MSQDALRCPVVKATWLSVAWLTLPTQKLAQTKYTIESIGENVLTDCLSARTT